MALAAFTDSSWASPLILAAPAACYIFLVLLPVYFKDRSSAGKSAHLRTAALLLLVVGVFLTAFTASIRLNYGGNASSVLGIETAAYFAMATVALLLARRRTEKAPG